MKKTNCTASFLLATAAFLGSSGFSSAVSVLNDGFETATHPGSPNFRTVFTPGSGGSAYYVVTNPSGATITADSTFGSRALTVTSPTAGYSIISPFGGTISLAAVGDTLTFGFKIRFTNTGASSDNAAFRFGIYNSNTTPVTGDNYGAATGDNDFGYGALLGNVTATAAGTTTLFNEGGTTVGTPILGGGDRAFLNSTAGPAIAAGNTLAHTVSMTLTRTSAGLMTIGYTVDGVTITATNSGSIRDSFDQIVFGLGYGTTPVSFNIDDVTLDASNFTPIPEPSSAMLLGLAGLSLLVRRRK